MPDRGSACSRRGEATSRRAMSENAKIHENPNRAGRVVRLFRTALSAYQSAAVLGCTTLILLVALNAMLSLAFRVKDAFFPEINPDAAAYHERLRGVYPGMSLDEIRELMAETWQRRIVYDPFTQFREGPFTGKYVNVHAAGFRIGLDQGPWPPAEGDLRIFMFGGSTLFGYGVRDEDTIASHLQRYLRERLGPKVSVYNFGQGAYFSAQERALWEQLLLAGRGHDRAIFIDGLNEFAQLDGEPAWTQTLRDFVAQQTNDWSQRWVSRTALARFVFGVRNRLGIAGEAGDRSGDGAAAQPVDPALIEAVCERYLRNKRLIEAVAAAYGISCVFVWQPIPTYQYEPSRHPFMPKNPSPPLRHAPRGYAWMAARRGDPRLGGNFLWLADLQNDQPGPLYVDQVHYNAAFSKTLAEAIGAWLLR